MNGVTSEPFSPLAILEAELAEMGERIGELEKTVAISPWVNMEAYSPKVTPGPQVRLEQGGASARWRGDLNAKEALPFTTVLFKVPPTYRPSEEVYLNVINASTGLFVGLHISTAGVVENFQEIPVGDYVFFSGVSYAVT